MQNPCTTWGNNVGFWGLWVSCCQYQLVIQPWSQYWGDLVKSILPHIGGGWQGNSVSVLHNVWPRPRDASIRFDFVQETAIFVWQTQVTQLLFTSDPHHCNVMEYPDKLTAPNIVLFSCKSCQKKSFDWSPSSHSKWVSQEPVHAGTRVFLWECRILSHCLCAVSGLLSQDFSTARVCKLSDQTFCFANEEM